MAEEPLCQEDACDQNSQNVDQFAEGKCSVRRRGIMDYMLSIPTTINEETSRSASTSPCLHKQGAMFPDAENGQNIEISVKIYASG